MIRLQKVNKFFNYKKKNEIHVINNTSLKLNDNGLVALLGPSGCGKTTLLNAIGGLDKVKSGQIFIDDYKITGKSPKYIDKIRTLKIGYIFQNYYLLDNKTVFENVAISLKMIGIKDKNEITKRVNYVLESLGIYRYRNRLASMISGGERQRVGIARAIVKNPDIIIADEPTGNLDSSNTIEIMNIIKSISKDKLVILVTHERELANFYADRIIEIEDGTITNDYDNKNESKLNYRIDNKIYLKDFDYITGLNKDNNDITVYNDNKSKLNLTIIVKNNNVYIKTNGNEKLEVIDNDSNIELIDDHYKEIDKSIYEKYNFDFKNIINEDYKRKYSSIINLWGLIKNGFKKVLDYSLIKKILLFGFLASGAFITFAICNIFGMNHIENSYFIKTNQGYYKVEVTPSIIEEMHNNIKQLDSIQYSVIGESQVSFIVKYPFYYQSMESISNLSGSLAGISSLNKDDVVYGRMPENEKEIVVDVSTITKMMKISEVPSMIGITNYEQFLNMKVYVNDDMDYTIVGFVDNDDPSIYTYESEFINILHEYEDPNDYYYYDDSMGVKDYHLFNIKLKKGRLPQNTYEIMVNINEEWNYPLNKTISEKVNDHKLKVVGYYEGDVSHYLTNISTIEKDLYKDSKVIMVMPKDVDKALEDIRNLNVKITSVYETDLNDYLADRRTGLIAGLTVAIVILFISFIEIYLMMRSSFLSRIKEVGIYRAIGVKKLDIYKMFVGEIFAITTISCIPGVLFVAYALNELQVIDYFKQNYMINSFTIIISIGAIYLFNLLVGLLPVANVVRKTPAEILARKDLD